MKEGLKEKKKDLANKYGEWTAHNIFLQDDNYTISKDLAGNETRLRKIVQIVADLAEKPINRLRILDLGCLEGLYAIEFARHGASVVGIEGREKNIVKARYAKEVLLLDNLTLYQDDVRNLCENKYGTFDVVLCLGILYHLNEPDIFYFIENIYKVCLSILVIDTHIAIAPYKKISYKGKIYYGQDFEEHFANSSSEERYSHSWASLDNLNSFWFTRPSLYNFLSNTGFSSVFECHIPSEISRPDNRSTFVALKGIKQNIYSDPVLNEREPELYNEIDEVIRSKKHKMKLNPLLGLFPSFVRSFLLRFHKLFNIFF